MLTGVLLGSFIFGLFVGSFLNVVILRFGKEPVTGRSHCPYCKKTLLWYELLPVVSFVFQAGRCRTCRARISWQYPAVEILTGLSFFLITARFLLWLPGLPAYSFFFTSQGWWIWPFILLWWYLAALLLVIAIYDLRHYLIPDRLVTLAIIGAVLNLVFSEFFLRRSPVFFPESGFLFSGPAALLLGRPSSNFLSLLLAAFFAFLVLGGAHFLSRGKAMGLGDVKLGFFSGVAFGWPDIFFTLIFSFFFGMIVSLVLLASRKKSLKSIVPFGPFLVLGSLTTLLFGDKILNAYLEIATSLFS